MEIANGPDPAPEPAPRRRSRSAYWEKAVGNVMQLPTPEQVTNSFRRIVSEDVRCARQGDALSMDTPLVLQDGHFFRAFVEIDDSGLLRVSDGGFTTSQFSIYSVSEPALRARGSEAGEIARELSLTWQDGEFSFAEDNLESALRRITVLVRAVDRAISLLEGKATRRPVALRLKLRDDLRAAGLEVKTRARIEIGGEPKPVIVDQLVRRNGRQAAVEVLTGRTQSGALISVDRAVANFHLLDHFKYSGLMIAVYDEESPAGAPGLISRFSNARPQAAEIIAGAKAAKAIQERLLPRPRQRRTLRHRAAQHSRA